MKVKDILLSILSHDALWRKLDQWFPPEPAPQPARAARRPRKTAQRPQAARIADNPNNVTYEAWKAGKTGHGPKITAPRGKGKEWSDRLYCENRLKWAKSCAEGRGSSKQYRAGSYNDRRRHGIRQAKGHAWNESIPIIESVIKGYNEDLQGMYWQGAREIVDEAIGTTQYYLYLAGN